MKAFYYSIFALVLLMALEVSGTQPERDSPPLISLEVESSRPQLVAGEGISIVGTIHNSSQSTVYVRESSLTMTLPVELEGSRSTVFGYPAYFPTEFHDRSKPPLEYFGNVIALGPGDEYAAYWTSSRRPHSDSWKGYISHQIETQLQYLFFYPGDYKILISGKYWTDPKLPPDGYRTVTKQATISVGAPLFVILIGAAIGGLIAYIILPKRPPKPNRLLQPFWAWVIRIWRYIIGIFGAILLSVIVTILLSRIAETQFIISVTVNDIWGAIVIGFFAQYGGTQLLDKLASSTRRDGSGGEVGDMETDQSTARDKVKHAS